MSGPVRTVPEDNMIVLNIVRTFGNIRNETETNPCWPWGG